MISFDDITSNPTSFGLAFLPRYFTEKPSWFHEEIGALASGPHRKLAIAAPRGHAKSTIFNLSEPIRRALVDGCRRQVLISATATFSGGWLRKIADEITTNHLLKSVWAIRPVTPWRESDEINFIVNGERRQIMARGADCQLRGEHFDAITMDDLEDVQNVRSEVQRRYLADWFYQTVVGSMEAHTKVHMIGTLIHHYCLLSTLVGDPTLGKPPKEGWETRIYRAVEGGLDNPHCTVLWPEKCDRRFLLSQRIEMGDIRFARELLNDPAPDEAVAFREEWFKNRWYNKLPPLENLNVCMYLDPNGGEGERKRSGADLDYAAIAVVGVVKHHPIPPEDFRGGDIYVLEVVRGKWDYLKILEECFRLYNKWSASAFFYEGVQFQAVLGQAFSQYCSERNLYPAVMKMDSIKSKEIRAKSVSNLCKEGRVWLPLGISMDFQQEFFSFPVVDHDDQTDALVGALRGVRQSSELWGEPDTKMPNPNATPGGSNDFVEGWRRTNAEYGFDADGGLHFVNKNKDKIFEHRQDLESW